MRIEFRYWKENSGYSHNETVGYTDGNMTAEEYVKSLEDAGLYQGDYDAINVELYDQDNNLVSEYFWKKGK